VTAPQPVSVTAPGTRAARLTAAGTLAPGTAASPGLAVLVRAATPADRPELERMFARCTVLTRYRRFHAPVKAIPARYLTEALSGSPLHYALVACPVPRPDEAGGARPTGSADVIALASCRLVAEGAAELGLIIEDAWQRRGLGTRLLRDLVAHASGSGIRVLEAQLLAEQSWIAGLLRGYGRCRLRLGEGGVLTVTIRVGAG
jgi:GNAT superfamily N-acetyltransferase